MTCRERKSGFVCLGWCGPASSEGRRLGFLQGAGERPARAFLTEGGVVLEFAVDPGDARCWLCLVFLFLGFIVSDEEEPGDSGTIPVSLRGAERRAHEPPEKVRRWLCISKGLPASWFSARLWVF